MNLEPVVEHLACSAVQRQAGGRSVRLYKLLESPRAPAVSVPASRRPSKPPPTESCLPVCSSAQRLRDCGCVDSAWSRRALLQILIASRVTQTGRYFGRHPPTPVISASAGGDVVVARDQPYHAQPTSLVEQREQDQTAQSKQAFLIRSGNRGSGGEKEHAATLCRRCAPLLPWLEEKRGCGGPK